MPITFKARVLLELGAELISSDAIAFYELIKNSLDAGSQKIIVKVQICLQLSKYKQLRELLVSTRSRANTKTQRTEF